MRALFRRLTVATFALGMLAAAPSPAGATGVAYIDGDEVWAASLDGTQKVRLSNGEGDWREVGQNDQGFVVATRRESGKIASLATFTIWRPDGTIKDFGPMAGITNGGSNAYPLELELTPDAGLVIYGFSNQVLHFPGSTLTQGFFLLPSATRIAPVGGPYSVLQLRYPSLIGDRVVASPEDDTVAVQEPGSVASKNFVPWPGVEAASGLTLEGLDVAPTGRYVALPQYQVGDPSVPTRVVVWPTPGLGEAPVPIPGAPIPGDVGDCWLVNGEASNPSFSPDGASLAWTDPRGVVVAGSPVVQATTPPDNLCTLSRPATVISATGKDPAVGGIDVGAIIAARTPATPGGGTGGAGAAGNPPVMTGVGGAGATPAAVVFGKFKSLKLASLSGKAGASVAVTPNFSGNATFTLTVDPKAIGKSGKKPVTIATGKSTVTAGKPSDAKLKANAAGKKVAKKLKKKQATLTVKIGDATATRTVTLT